MILVGSLVSAVRHRVFIGGGIRLFVIFVFIDKDIIQGRARLLDAVEAGCLHLFRRESLLLCDLKRQRHEPVQATLRCPSSSIRSHRP